MKNKDYDFKTIGGQDFDFSEVKIIGVDIAKGDSQGVKSIFNTTTGKYEFEYIDSQDLKCQ